MIGNPVPRAGAQHQASALPAYSEAVSGTQAQLAQQVGRQGYLIFAAYCAHDGLILAVNNILYRRL
jgi:hypothetical protein